MQDAETAGLAGKKNWKQYEDSMLTWRAVSRLCRNLFSDVVLGAGYVPEELGADVYANGDPIEPDYLILSANAKDRLIEAVGRERAIELWGERGNQSIYASSLHQLIESDRSIYEGTNDSNQEEDKS